VVVGRGVFAGRRGRAAHRHRARAEAEGVDRIGARVPAAERSERGERGERGGERGGGKLPHHRSTPKVPPNTPKSPAAFGLPSRWCHWPNASSTSVVSRPAHSTPPPNVSACRLASSS